MSHCETLFVEAWKADVDLTANGETLHLEALSQPSDELLEKLRTHKTEMLRFLSSWVDTPYGEAKFWGFLGKNRCGVVLRHQPDKVTFVRRDELGIKPSVESR